MPTSPERLDQWERGERRPTVKQLRRLANAYRRPIAVLYLFQHGPLVNPLQAATFASSRDPALGADDNWTTTRRRSEGDRLSVDPSLLDRYCPELQGVAPARRSRGLTAYVEGD